MAEAYTNPFGEGSKAQTYDIVNDYDWTTAPAGSKLREQTPNAYVTAYKMEFSQLQQFIDGYINIASSSARAEKLGNNPGLQFYKDMYSSGSVLADINFPFFDDNIRGFTSEYENTFSPISQRAGTFLFGDQIEKLGGAAENLIGGAIAGGRELGNLGGNAMAEKVAGGVGAFGQMAGGAFEKLTGKKLPGLQTVGAPGSYIETPKFYQYSNTDEGINIEFVLSNTLNDYRGNKGFKQNLKFIKEFTMMNRPYRYGPIEMTFPAIYHLEIPGLRYIEWAYLENFGIKLIGARRRIGKNIIPEAYGFNFQFKSLTIEAANFVQMTDRVEGFDEGDASYRALREEADKDSAAREFQKKKELDAAQKRLEAAAAEEAKRKAKEDADKKAEEERLLREEVHGETREMGMDTVFSNVDPTLQTEEAANNPDLFEEAGYTRTADILREQDQLEDIVLNRGNNYGMSLPEGTRERLGIGDFNPDNISLSRSNNYGANLPVWQQRAKLGRVINPNPPGQSDRDIQLNQLSDESREVGNMNRTDLTDYEVNNNQMVENTRKYWENVEVAEQFAQQTRDAEAAQRATIPEYLLRDSNAAQPVEEKNE
jgi:hypothetical protein